MTPDVRAPHQIVENARRFILANLGKPLNTTKVAKGIGVSVEDLTGSYQCATPTSFERDLIKIRMNALYESIRMDPTREITEHISSVGLWNPIETATKFEEEFWITLDDHQHNCLGLN